ncbi:MAG TPA: hypothetical protein VII76_06125 [Acidimicrobiales bacterium]
MKITQLSPTLLGPSEFLLRLRAPAAQLRAPFTVALNRSVMIRQFRVGARQVLQSNEGERLLARRGYGGPGATPH